MNYFILLHGIGDNLKKILMNLLMASTTNYILEKKRMEIFLLISILTHPILSVGILLSLKSISLDSIGLETLVITEILLTLTSLFSGILSLSKVIRFRINSSKAIICYFWNAINFVLLILAIYIIAYYSINPLAIT